VRIRAEEALLCARFGDEHKWAHVTARSGDLLERWRRPQHERRFEWTFLLLSERTTKCS